MQNNGGSDKKAKNVVYQFYAYKSLKNHMETGCGLRKGV